MRRKDVSMLQDLEAKPNVGEVVELDLARSCHKCSFFLPFCLRLADEESIFGHD